MTALPQNPAQRPPNVILIIMDDLGYGDLACHANPYTRTPHLDRMHAGATRLTRMTSAPVCTPARAALMTGRYPQRTRAIDTYCGRSMMDPDEVTLAEMFRDAGYRTGIFGKWHLGDNYPMRPIDKGFDHALVHNGGGLRQPGNIGRDAYFDPQLMLNGKLTDCKGYCTDIFTDHALQFIEQHRDQPFFTYLATNAPHTPLEVDEALVDHYREQGLPENHARLYAMVENIDHNVGRVFAKLDELNLTDETLVIYTSDHGPCPGSNHEGEIRFNAGLRDQKMSVYEGGIRVPSFWHWPGHFAAGRDVNVLTNAIDVAPTLAEICGLQMPNDRTIDGISLTPLLDGESLSGRWPARNIFIQWHRGDAPQRFRNCAVIQQRFKLVNGVHLYDLLDDPGEVNDIAGDYPLAVQKMRAAYEQWFDTVSAERGYDPPRIVLDRSCECPSVLTRQDWRVTGPDGWSDDHDGLWWVRAAKTERWHVRVRFAAMEKPAILMLSLGSMTLRADVAADATEHVFEDVTMPVGNAFIQGWLVAEDRRTSVQYVHFE